MEGPGLTDSQNHQWQQIGKEVLASSQIKYLAAQYYLEYRQHLSENNLANTQVFNSVQLANLFRVAYFLSEKKQETFNVQGQKINAIALSVNGIIKKTVDSDAFISHLKEMMKVVTINDENVEREIGTFIKSFLFTTTFNNKFISTFQKIKPSSEDAHLQQSLLWLLFIYAKKILLNNQNDIIETTCLIAALFIHYIRQKAQSNQGDIEFFLDDPNYGGKLNKESIEHVFLEYFRLKDMTSYTQVTHMFKNLLKEISPKKNIFAQETLQFSYKNLDKIYQKKLTETCIDERHFLKDRINTVLNANKFTPFGGKRTVAKIKSTEKNKIMSHKILNFEKHEDDDSEETEPSTGQGLLKNLKLTKTPYTTLIKMTPMTLTMEMHNWVLQKSNYYKFNPIQLPKFITIGSSISEKSQKMIFGLWKDICSIVSEETQLSETDRSIYIALAMEIVFFVNHSTSCPIEETIKNLGISWFHLWSKIDSVLKYNDKMPREIKFHLLSLETSIVSSSLWKEESILFSILKQEKELGAKLRESNPEYERLYKRIIHEIVYQIFFMSKKLNLHEQITNIIFQVSQFVINQIPQVCMNRNLNHAMLCSTYAICKIYDVGKTFHEILISYKELNNIGKEGYNDILEKIPYEGDFVDIITFYNKSFIKKAKGFILEILEKGKTEKTKNYINNPVKQLLSHNVVAMAENITMTPGSQTPFTQQLRAYNESPLFIGKKVQQGLGKFLERQNLLQKKQSSSKEDSISTAKSMISNKFSSTKIKSPEARTTIKKM